MNNNRVSDFVDEIKVLAESGVSTGDMIQKLHERGATIVESMQVLTLVTKRPLGVVKAEVTVHPCWYK